MKKEKREWEVKEVKEGKGSGWLWTRVLHFYDFISVVVTVWDTQANFLIKEVVEIFLCAEIKLFYPCRDH